MIKPATHLHSRLRGLDKLRYLTWRLAPLSPEITVRLATGERISIRRPPEPDLHTAYEVFAANAYTSPHILNTASIKRVIDIGANIGCTVVHWCHTYRRARVDAVEPHPRSRKRLIHNVTVNGLEDRVTVHPFAAGTAGKQGFLTDDGLRSTLTDNRGEAGIPIRIVDFYELVGDKPVDLLKLDCEGGEYQIVMDPRFDGFRAQAVVMEWHNNSERPRAAAQMVERLTALRWHVELTDGDPAEGETGLLWAYL